MCLGVPGRILKVAPPSRLSGEAIATVDFQGSRVEVSLALVPEAKVQDWVLVHAGFALTLLDEREAAETWRWLDLAEVKAEVSRAGGAGARP
jgi:hydrogenase expression/formation protein HypC